MWRAVGFLGSHRAFSTHCSPSCSPLNSHFQYCDRDRTGGSALRLLPASTVGPVRVQSFSRIWDRSSPRSMGAVDVGRAGRPVQPADTDLFARFSPAHAMPHGRMTGRHRLTVHADRWTQFGEQPFFTCSSGLRTAYPRCVDPGRARSAWRPDVSAIVRSSSVRASTSRSVDARRRTRRSV
jgi:hypothetical protein